MADNGKAVATRAPQHSGSVAQPGRVSRMPTPEIMRWLRAEPPSDAALTAKIRATLSHYYRPDLSLEEEDLVLEDWTDDLAGFPTWAIAAAFTTWRRANPQRRPSPGGIRALCMAETARLRAELDARRPDAPEPEPTPEELEAKRARAEAIMRKAGYPVHIVGKGGE